MDEEITPGEERLSIPKEFHSYDTGKPFSNCIICNRDLLASYTPYIIEKSIKRYADLNATDVLYEYAICMPCALEQKKAMSVESLRNTEQYFLTNLNKNRERAMDTMAGNKLQNCLLFGEPIDEMTEYVIQATCVGDKLSPMISPYVIGERAMHDISELISMKTRDEIDGFIDRFFGGPPEFRELLRKRKVVLV